MSHKIKFGTDGWRGKIAEDYTFANVRRCAQGFATYLNKHGHKGKWVVVGHDKRFLGENFAVAVAEVVVVDLPKGLDEPTQDAGDCVLGRKRLLANALHALVP